MVSSDPSRAVQLGNMYPLELDKPTTFAGRPGFTVAGAIGGTAGKRTGQYVGQFTKDDGTEYTVRIIGGQGIQTYNWSTDTWTTVVTVANLTTALITLSETAHVFGVTYTNKLVLTDGVNTPFTWDGTAGPGGLTSLTNAPVFYGKPTVYYAKLFAIKASDRKVIVWSEEQDPTVGYEQAAYNNSWQLIQSDTGQLVTITGTNEALYYQRTHSSAAIFGAVTSDFKTDGTRSGVDETVGTLSPAGLFFRDSRGFFIDARARPHVIEPGAGLKECWQDIHETLQGIDITAAQLAKSITLYDQRIQCILFCVTQLSQSNPSLIIVFNPVLNIPVAVWTGFTLQDIAVVKDGNGSPTLMHLSDDGYSYTHGDPDGSVWSDGLVAGTAAISHVVQGPHVGADTKTEKKWIRADALLRADANATSISFDYETPYGISGSQSASVMGGSARWDDVDWDAADALWSTSTVENHIPFGLLTTARWLRPRLTHAVAGEQFGFEALSVDAEPATQTPYAL